MMNNNDNRSWAQKRAYELFGDMATGGAQAEEMEIKEMDPDGNMIMSTEDGLSQVKLYEDSLYSDNNDDQINDTVSVYDKDFNIDELDEFKETSDSDDVNYLLDPLFDGFKGIIQTFTGMNSGAVMRNQQTIDELNFMERALQIEEQFRAIDKQLDAAIDYLS